jgi:uncharacterized protein affecting Mg2+/Co2+ transport
VGGRRVQASLFVSGFGSLDVLGDGVIGLFPVLREGGYRSDEQGRVGEWCEGCFAYQSCSGAMGPGGSFGGELTFVPGTMASPTGPPFEVRVAPFALDLPPFVF